MKRQMVILLSLLALAACLFGCASARYVMVEPGGGTVAVPANYPRHREAAVQLMKEKCPGGYDITREEEVPVGTSYTSQTDIEPIFIGRNDERITSEYRTSVKTEWRIQFRCK